MNVPHLLRDSNLKNIPKEESALTNKFFSLRQLLKQRLDKWLKIQDPNWIHFDMAIRTAELILDNAKFSSKKNY